MLDMEVEFEDGSVATIPITEEEYAEFLENYEKMGFEIDNVDVYGEGEYI